MVVWWALFLLAATLLLVPTGSNGRAEAQAQSNAYQPFPCQQGGVAQQRRQSLPLLTTSGSAGSGTMYPCISGVQWRMQAGWIYGATPPGTAANIGAVYDVGTTTLYSAAAGSALKFYNYTNFIKLATIPGTPATAPTSNYTLSITPDGPITIGGAGVLTDLWATGNSAINVAGYNAVCWLVGSSDGNGCRISVSTFQSINWLMGGSNFELYGLDLTFGYLVTHANNPADPYQNPPAQPSVQLPNTTISLS